MEDKYSVSLKEYFERVLSEQKDAQSKALSISTAELHRRLDILNGADDERRDLIARCLTRDEYGIRHEQLIREINDLKLAKAHQEGATDRSNIIASIALAGVFIDILLRLFGK